MRRYFVPLSALLCFAIIVTAFVGANNIQYFMPTNIQFSALTKPVQKQIECLAENIYFEAAHEPVKGQVAVAMVTLNRVSSGNYAKDICGVVNQKTNGTCQFSWVCMPNFTSKRLTIKETRLYNDIRDLAMNVVLNYENITDVTKGATYYHADYVNPGWGFPQTIKIGAHIFYKRESDLRTMKKEIKL